MRLYCPITAHNTGIKDTGAFNLALYDGDPARVGYWSKIIR